MSKRLSPYVPHIRLTSYDSGFDYRGAAFLAAAVLYAPCLEYINVGWTLEIDST
jgi:hypothetical protein